MVGECQKAILPISSNLPPKSQVLFFFPELTKASTKTTLQITPFTSPPKLVSS